MTNEPLAPIFLDDKPITLKDPKPKVSAVLSAGGQAGDMQVKWLQTQAGTQGTFLRPDATLDRTSEPTKAIYLTSLLRGPSSPLPAARPSARVPLVDEDIVARPFTANKGKTTTPWSTPAKAEASDEADEDAMDNDDADVKADDDAGDDGDEHSAGTKSGE